MRVAILTTDNREHHRKYNLTNPYFGPAIEALLQGFAEQNKIEIHVISCTQRPMRAPGKIADNIWFHLLEVPKIGWLRTGYQGCIRAIRKKLQEIQPRLVHGQGTERECALSAVCSGFPNVVTIHGNMTAIAKSTEAPIGSFWWWAAILERFTLPRTLGVFCNSRYTESVVQARARQIWRVPNAIRTEFFTTPLPARPTSSRPIVLNVGTISPRKRQIALLDLAQELQRDGYSFELHFIGDANDREKYAREFLSRIEMAKESDCAHYLGTKSLSELIQSLDAASALVHVPYEEAFGLVAAEALARNLKFFGTKIGGLADIVKDVEKAELFDLDDKEGLRRAIAKWLDDSWPQPTTAAHTMRSRYHPNLIAGRHAEIYRQISDKANGSTL